MLDQVSITLSWRLHKMHHLMPHNGIRNLSDLKCNRLHSSEILLPKWNLPSWLEISLIHLTLFVSTFCAFAAATITTTTTLTSRNKLFYSFLFDFIAVAFTFQPEFAEPIVNISVAVGRDATFTCHVRHLGGYRVSIYFLCLANTMLSFFCVVHFTLQLKIFFLMVNNRILTGMAFRILQLPISFVLLFCYVL